MWGLDGIPEVEQQDSGSEYQCDPLYNNTAFPGDGRLSWKYQEIDGDGVGEGDRYA